VARGSNASLRVKAERLDAIIEDVLELMTEIGRVDSASPGRTAAARARRRRRRALLARRAYDGSWTCALSRSRSPPHG
jgi:hypothetical protein